MAGRKGNMTPEMAMSALKESASMKAGKVRRRLQAIAKLSEMPMKDVATLFDVRRETISRWIKAYAEHGIDGLKDRPKGHYPSKLNDSQKKQISRWFREQKDSSGKATHWTVKKMQAEIAKVFGISIGYSPLRLHLLKMGFVLRKPHHDPSASEN